MAEARESSFREAVRTEKFVGQNQRQWQERQQQQQFSDLNQDDLRQEFASDEHRLELNQLIEHLSTSISHGLTSAEADARLSEDGPNELTPPEPVPIWVRLSRAVLSGFSLLLLLGSVLCFIAYGVKASSMDSESPRDNLYIGIVLLFVVVLTAGFSYFQEARSAQLIDKFNECLPHMALVLRDGQKTRLPSHRLVPGDIVTISAGDRIPADVRILTAHRFRVDNSQLTGESEPQARSHNYTSENPLETENLAFFSTYAVEGNCTAVVVRTGDNTLIGRIANLASGLEPSRTLIGKEVERFVRIITVIAVLMGLTLFITAFALQYDWLEAIIFLIGIIVANVPEGLLATVTICLTLTAQRMAGKNCYVRSLEAVESLGCCSVICTDKTGTLTVNRMSVSHTWHSGRIWDADSAEWAAAMPDPRRTAGSDWLRLSRCMMLCSRAEFSIAGAADADDSFAQRRICVGGDPSEAALLQFAEWTGAAAGGVDQCRRRHPKLCEIPFNSESKFQASVHSDGPGYLLVMKGAPEVVLDKCSSLLCNSASQPLTDQWRQAVTDACAELGASGERVLGFCDLRLPPGDFPPGYAFDACEENFPLNGLRFLGLASMMDPPRTAVPDAVQKCRSAGIKVIMITGDHPATARSVARHVGIIGSRSKTAEDIAAERGVDTSQVDPREADACVVHGSDLADMTRAQLDELISGDAELVFARTSPQLKLLIVESCQRLGHTVAVTGDGVSDSPALRRADIGIAMGLAGSDVGRHAADIVLVDDNFATIVTGIEEGRILFDNLKKSIAYTLTSNIPEVMPFLMFLLFDLPLPIGAMTVLCIDLGTDLAPAVSLAFEAPETDAMRRPPRDPKQERLVNERLLAVAFAQIGIVQAAGGLSVYFVVMAENGFWPQRLFFLRRQWDSEGVVDLEDSYGQEWAYWQRKRLQYTAHAAFFASIVLMQWANLLACKTRVNSLLQQGMGNHFLTLALVVETVLAVVFVYCPGLNQSLQMQPLRFDWWLPAAPFGLFILTYEEIRKLLLRYLPSPWKGANPDFLTGF